jgi:hypothetical protein
MAISWWRSWSSYIHKEKPCTSLSSSYLRVYEGRGDGGGFKEPS